MVASSLVNAGASSQCGDCLSGSADFHCWERPSYPRSGDLYTGDAPHPHWDGPLTEVVDQLTDLWHNLLHDYSVLKWHFLKHALSAANTSWKVPILCCLKCTNGGVQLILVEAETKWPPFPDDIFKRIFYLMKMYEFRLKIHWDLILGFDLAIFHWFR